MVTLPQLIYSTACLSFCLLIVVFLCFLCFCVFCLFVFLSFYLFIFLSFCLFVFLSFCLLVFLSFCPFVFLSFCLFSFCLCHFVLVLLPYSFWCKFEFCAQFSRKSRSNCFAFIICTSKHEISTTTIHWAERSWWPHVPLKVESMEKLNKVDVGRHRFIY